MRPYRAKKTRSKLVINYNEIVNNDYPIEELLGANLENVRARIEEDLKQQKIINAGVTEVVVEPKSVRRGIRNTRIRSILTDEIMIECYTECISNYNKARDNYKNHLNAYNSILDQDDKDDELAIKNLRSIVYGRP
jgi:hypothetical protein